MNDPLDAPLKITSDPKISEDQFVLFKEATEVAGGTVNMMYVFLADFPHEQYDEIAVHPKNFPLLQAMDDSL